jgi:hypothetical protein
MWCEIITLCRSTSPFRSEPETEIGEQVCILMTTLPYSSGKHAYLRGQGDMNAE